MAGAAERLICATCVDGAPLELLYTPAKNNLTQRYWYVLDGRGNVVALTDPTGKVVDRYHYDLWGAPVTDRESSLPGETAQSGLGAGGPAGWYWLSVRHYDPSLRRFLQPDPSQQEGTRSYTYAGDDPLDATDPSGLGPYPCNAECRKNYKPISWQEVGDVAGKVAAGAIVAWAMYQGVAHFIDSIGGDSPTAPLAAAGGAGVAATLIEEEAGGAERGASAVAGGSDETLTYYHGTNSEGAQSIRNAGIDLSRGRTNLDFNPSGQRGFYTTTNYRQALQRANVITRIYGGESEVLQFEVPAGELGSLNAKVFATADAEWGEFVTAGRLGTLEHSYDYVEGPVLRNPDAAMAGEPAMPLRSGGGNQLAVFSQPAADLFMRFLQ